MWEILEKIGGKRRKKIKGYLGEVGLNERYVVIEKDKKKKANKGWIILWKLWVMIVSKWWWVTVYFYNETEVGNLKGRKKSSRVIDDSTCDVVIWKWFGIWKSIGI